MNRAVGKGGKSPGRPRGLPKTGGGSRKGIPNKVTSDLRAMILGALDQAGGADYLQRQADESPAAFLSLVGRCLPRDINLTAKVSLADLVKEARARLDAK